MQSKQRFDVDLLSLVPISLNEFNCGNNDHIKINYFYLKQSFKC